MQICHSSSTPVLRLQVEFELDWICNHFVFVVYYCLVFGSQPFVFVAYLSISPCLSLLWLLWQTQKQSDCDLSCAPLIASTDQSREQKYKCKYPITKQKKTENRRKQLVLISLGFQLVGWKICVGASRAPAPSKMRSSHTDMCVLVYMCVLVFVFPMYFYLI